MKKNPSPDHCPICGQHMDVICSGYRFTPFIDGRCYEAICHLCHELPCFYRFDEDIWMWKQYSSEDRELHTVEEMVQHGFDKKQAAISLKAVKRAIKKGKYPK